ncbi:hypothetical protein LY474_25535 [Myxococcus stipitatus]|uniref:hypothetical protein n=1 Tax=Myxococcus stipitatus TaxID=83455 RepID=UPI001F20538F|nr:hypothetical protein [Myxococcus stipitatus]MCE9671177.1 hypothetical protein [Myxococcus stipitatus]
MSDILRLGLLLALGVAPTQAPAAPFVPAPRSSPARALPSEGPTHLHQGASIPPHERRARQDVPRMQRFEASLRDVLRIGPRMTVDLRRAVNDWVDVTGFARGPVVTSPHANPLLVDGATLELVGEAGGVIRLLRGDTDGTLLSLRGHFGFDKSREITLLPLVESLLDSTGMTSEELVEQELGEFVFIPEQEATVHGGLFVAQVLDAVFAVQGSVSAEFAWQRRRPFDSLMDSRVVESTHAVRVFLALAVTADLSPVTRVPLALMAEYVFRTGAQEQVDAADTLLEDSTVGLGLYYSGNPDLQVGLGAVATLDMGTELSVDAAGRPVLVDEPTRVYGQLLIRYVW